MLAGLVFLLAGLPLRSTNVSTSKHLTRTRKKSAYAERAKSVVLVNIRAELTAAASHLSYSVDIAMHSKVSRKSDIYETHSNMYM